MDGLLLRVRCKLCGCRLVSPTTTSEPLKIPMWKCSKCGYKSFSATSRRVYNKFSESIKSNPITSAHDYDVYTGKLIVEEAVANGTLAVR